MPRILEQVPSIFEGARFGPPGCRLMKCKGLQIQVPWSNLILLIYIYISYIMINDLIKKDQGLGVELVKLVKPENFDEFPTILGIFGEFWALQALETPSADWRHATVAWLRRAELFAPPLLPKMRGGKDGKVGASGGRCGFLEHQLIPVLRCWNHPHMTLYGFALGGWAVTSYATCTLLWQWVMLVTRLYVLKWEHNTPKSFPDDPNWWT